MSDTTTNSRSRLVELILYWVGLGAAIYTIVAMTLVYFTPMRFAATHYAFIFTIIYLSYPGAFRANKREKWKGPSVVDIILLVASLTIFSFVVIDYDNIIYRVPSPTILDQVMAVVLIFIVIDATRRVIGWSIPIIAICMIIYTVFGQYFPGMLHHRGYGLERITTTQFLDLTGVFGGSGITTIATIVFAFIMLASILTAAGGGEFLRNLSVALAGRSRGGAAKIAVISSAFFGSIQGSSITNVVTTGSFTIPLMKRTGFTPTYAAAIEAAASSGGQILPPIMGASAFLVAEFIGLPYSKVATAAAIPAVLYFLSVYAQVHFYAAAHDIRAITSEDEATPAVGKAIAAGWPFVPPFVLLVWLIVIRYPISLSALYTVLCLVVLTLTARTITLKGVVDATSSAFRDMAKISSAVACAGIVVGLLNLTGMGIKLGYLIVEAAQGHLLFALVITMVVTLVLGIGLPTIGAYVIASSVAAPALIEIGLPPLTAHMFILYFAAVSSLTPPVAICVYTAAAIAGSRGWTTGWLAFRLALVAYVVPFIFVFSPALLMEGSWADIIWHSATAAAGIMAFSVGVAGFTFMAARQYERVLFILGGAFLFEPSMLGNWTGFALAAVPLLSQHFRARRSRTVTPSFATGVDPENKLSKPVVDGSPSERRNSQ